jgi:hypothetical protein
MFAPMLIEGLRQRLLCLIGMHALENRCMGMRRCRSCRRYPSRLYRWLFGG